MGLNRKKKTIFTVISVILAVIVLEVGLQVINCLMELFKPRTEDNVLLSHYPDKQMADTLWTEMQATRKDPDYIQFLGWASKPYRGTYVNTDAQQGRKTWNPATFPGQSPQLIYLLGGSAAWGFGVRDDYTIPSYLSKILHEHGENFLVFNYGEPGYTFTQGIIHLILMLREGNRPNYVIFYDGFNDLYAAHQHGKAGTIHNIGMMSEKLKMRYRDFVWQGIIEAFRKYCMIYKVINGTYIYLNPTVKYHEVAVTYSDNDLQSLAKSAVDDLRKSMDFLDHLSQVYHFKYIVCWQPTIFTEGNAAVESIYQDPRIEDVSLGKICRYAHAYLQTASIPHFYNFTDVLSEKTGPVYIDIAHITEKGNEIIAQRIYRIFTQEFLSQPGRTVEDVKHDG